MLLHFTFRMRSYIDQPPNVLDEGKNLKLVDAPVSGGVKRASMGTLTVQKYCLFFY